MGRPEIRHELELGVQAQIRRERERGKTEPGHVEKGHLLTYLLDSWFRSPTRESRALTQVPKGKHAHGRELPGGSALEPSERVTERRSWREKQRE